MRGLRYLLVIMRLPVNNFCRCNPLGQRCRQQYPITAAIPRQVPGVKRARLVQYAFPACSAGGGLQMLDGLPAQLRAGIQGNAVTVNGHRNRFCLRMGAAKQAAPAP